MFPFANYYSQTTGRQAGEYNLTVVTPPASEPIPYKDVARQLNLSENDDRELVVGLTDAAQKIVEDHTGLALSPTTYDVSFDRFDDQYGLVIPKRPVTSVTSVKYLDASGVQQTLSTSAYDVDAKLYTRIRPKYATCFPVSGYAPNSVTVRFVAGASTVPSMAAQVVKMLAVHLYENRGEEAADLPESVLRMLALLSAPTF
jgi:uncharacterized phiE125 gp8 family phage protein